MIQMDSEDMQAFMSKHSYAVAYAQFPYDYLVIEQDIIDYLLRKVVLMRELPLVKATKSLTYQRDF